MAETFTRSYELALTEGDGRTLDARLVPYNTPATVTDPPDFTPYREMFVPGAFGAQARAANRVYLTFEHQQGIGGVVGRGLELRDGPDDLHGSFRMLDGADSDKALELIREGVIGGVSIEFRSLRQRTVDGVVQRLRAHLDKVSLVRFPAYQAAQVVAVRAGEPLSGVEALLPEFYDRLSAQGVTAPAWALSAERERASIGAE